MFFTLILLISFSACGGGGTSNSNDNNGTPPNETTESSYYKGVGEPFATSTVTGFNYNTASYLLKAIGSKTFRMWMSDAILYAGYSNTTVYTDEQLSTISNSGKIQINSLRWNSARR